MAENGRTGKANHNLLSPRTQGAFPVSLQKPWVFLIPPPQHSLAPPGLPEQPVPAQEPQLRGQL